MDILKKIDLLDKHIVLSINEHHTYVMDQIMIFFSHKYMPIPIYILLVYLLYKHLGWKNCLYIVLPALVVVISMADYTSSGIFKPWIARLRPCYALENINLPNGCGGQYGFFSSHAANSFAVATLIFLLLKEKQKNIGYIVFAWAIPVSLSRIYLAVHYPSDILVGMLFGILCGYLVYLVSLKFLIKEF